MSERNIEDKIEEIREIKIDKVGNRKFIGKERVKKEDFKVGIGIVGSRVKFKIRKGIEIEILGVIEMSGGELGEKGIEIEGLRREGCNVDIIR